MGVTDKIMVEAAQLNPSMYCFAYAMQDVGSTKKYYEMDLLRGQYQKGIGILACDAWGAWSDKPSELAPGKPIKTVSDDDGDSYFAIRKETGTWINTGHFTQVQGCQGRGRLQELPLGRQGGRRRGLLP